MKSRARQDSKQSKQHCGVTTKTLLILSDLKVMTFFVLLQGICQPHVLFIVLILHIKSRPLYNLSWIKGSTKKYFRKV